MSFCTNFVPSHYEYQVPSTFDTVFVLHNTGETNDLIPVINNYREHNPNMRVLALGVAVDLVKGKIPQEYVVTLPELGIETTIDKSAPRTKILTVNEVERIVNLLPAKQLVAGIPSLVQEQLFTAYRKLNAKTLAYWDNFSANGPDIYFSTAVKVQAAAEFVLFPSKSIADAPVFSNRPSSQKIVVGKPSMKEWLNTFKAIDCSKVRKDADIAQKDFVVTWIGGYGPEHKKAFELFVACFPHIKNGNSQTKLVISQHPNASKQELDPYSYFDKNDPRIVPETCKLSTMQASAISDIVLTYNSTAGLQAMLAGKKVIFIVPKDDGYSNIAIDLAILPKISDMDTLRRALRSNTVAENPWIQLGIPQETVESEKAKSDSVSRFQSCLHQ